MAEKEERIWLEYDIPKPKGAVEAFCCTTMTRQEAIERMEKAMKQYAQDEEVYTDKDLAICALNSLLEETK